MKKNQFYTFGSKLSGICHRARPRNILKIDEIKLIRGEASTDEPSEFEYQAGREVCDLVDTGFASLFLISRRIREAFETNKITGWKVFPITFSNDDGIRILEFDGLSVIGRCGPIEIERSKIVTKQLAPHAPLAQYYKGLLFDENSWDGSDIFLPEFSQTIIVTSRVKEILNRGKFSNVRLELTNNIEYPEMTAQLIKRNQT